MGLDFSKLDKIAYRDFDTPEAQQTKDDLIEKGFAVVEDKANPFIGAEAAQMPNNTPQKPCPAPEPYNSAGQPKRPLKPFKSATGLDYRAFYGDLYRWHERYTALVQQDADAWAAAADAWIQLGQRYNAEATPYVQQVLLSTYEEVEREYKAARQQAQ